MWAGARYSDVVAKVKARGDVNRVDIMVRLTEIEVAHEKLSFIGLLASVVLDKLMSIPIVSD